MAAGVAVRTHATGSNTQDVMIISLSSNCRSRLPISLGPTPSPRQKADGSAKPEAKGGMVLSEWITIRYRISANRLGLLLTPGSRFEAVRSFGFPAAGRRTSPGSRGAATAWFSWLFPRAIVASARQVREPSIRWRRKGGAMRSLWNERSWAY